MIWTYGEKTWGSTGKETADQTENSLVIRGRMKTIGQTIKKDIEANHDKILWH